MESVERVPPAPVIRAGCFPSYPERKRPPGQTQDTWERLHLPLGLGTPQYPPGGDGGSSQGEDGPEPRSLLLPLPRMRMGSDGALSRHSLCGPGKPQRMFNVYPRIVLPAGLFSGNRRQQETKRQKHWITYFHTLRELFLLVGTDQITSTLHLGCSRCILPLTQTSDGDRHLSLCLVV